MRRMVGQFVLKKHNIDRHTDLDLAHNIDFANLAGAFVAGDYEYVHLFEPTASVMEKEGKGHVVASFGEESGKVPYTVFMTKQSFLTDNEDVAIRFTKAIYKAQQWVQDNSSEEIAKVLQPYFDDTDLDMLAASLERYKNQNSFATDPILDEEEWDNLKNIMDEAGELPADVPYTDLVNTEIAKKVIGN